MEKELISIIMSTYNEEQVDIERAITSILSQTYKNIEFIIICDKPDNHDVVAYLRKLNEEDQRVQCYMNEQNCGLTASLNTALRFAQGDYIARMDADDFSMPERLAHQKNFLEAHGYDLIGSYVECVNTSKETLYNLKNMPVEFSSIKKKCLYNNPLAHPTWFGKKAVFVKNKGYRNIPYAEDYDFLLRAIQNGFRLGNANESLLKYTIREASISTSNGLRQYFVSQILVEAYKNKTLENVNEEMLASALRNIKQKDEDNYARAASLFEKAVKKAKHHNITFGFDVIAACFSSKYYFKKIIGYLRTFY